MIRLAWPLILAAGACDREAIAPFVVDPDCVNDEPLDVVLVEEIEPSTLREVGEGVAVTVQYGVQGGQHLLLGVRIRNPHLDPPGARVTYTAHWCAGDCEQADLAGHLLTETVPGMYQWREEADGVVRLGSYFVLVTAPRPDTYLWLEVEVVDGCGREARLEWVGVPEGV